MTINYSCRVSCRILGVLLSQPCIVEVGPKRPHWKSASKHPTSLCLLGFSNLSENLRFGAHRAPGRPCKISGTSRGISPLQIARQAERESCRSGRKKGPLLALQGKKNIRFDDPFRIHIEIGTSADSPGTMGPIYV